MIVVTRYRVPVAEQDAFLAEAREALALLLARPGSVRGRVGRATDDAELFVLVTEWDGVGAYRRALGAFEVKVGAVPLLSRAIDEPSAFEILHARDVLGAIDSDSARAPDADVSPRGRGGAAPW